MKILIAILVFGILVAVHELGHFLIGKLFNTKVREFAIGMGVPILFKKKVGETVYSIRALPLGGFCDFGEDEVEEGNQDPRLFNNKSPWIRMAIVTAGPIFNFILALLIFIVLVQSKGYQDTQIQKVLVDGPAYTAGIREGDKIVELNGEKTILFKQIFLELYKLQREKKQITEPINVVVKRDGELKSYNVTPAYDKSRGVYIIGIQTVTKRANPITAVQYGYYEMKFSMYQMIYGLKELVLGKVSKEEVAGPVGIVKMVGETAKEGLPQLAFFTAMLSINLGVINLLPLPALDGSRFLISLVEGITHRRVNRKLEVYFHTIGFIGLMLLMILVTMNDIRKLFI